MARCLNCEAPTNNRLCCSEICYDQRMKLMLRASKQLDGYMSMIDREAKTRAARLMPAPANAPAAAPAVTAPVQSRELFAVATQPNGFDPDV